MTTTLAQLNAFITELKQHDWAYEYSDCFRTWQRGDRVERELKNKASSDRKLLTAYLAYSDFAMNRNNVTRERREQIIADLIAQAEKDEAHA